MQGQVQPPPDPNRPGVPLPPGALENTEGLPLLERDSGLVDPSEIALNRNHSNVEAFFYMVGISLCIAIDILQYSMPLSFLPQVLEDRGYKTLPIATVVGGYYWTGFAGGVCITSYQISRVLKGERNKGKSLALADVRLHVKYLVFGLMVGTISLAAQAMYPTFQVHLCCRLLQGFVGAFLFFYTYLLAIELFKGKQQLVALTSTSVALNCAEAFGSFIGAWLYTLGDEGYKQFVVFFTLSMASLVNQLLLFGVLYMLTPSYQRHKGPHRGLMEASPFATPRTGISTPAYYEVSGWERVCVIVKNGQLHFAVLLIVAAALVKGAVEEMLPFFADHHWHFDPYEVGLCFTTIAVSYILASSLVASMWTDMSEKARAKFVAGSLVALGGFSVLALLTYAMKYPATMKRSRSAWDELQDRPNVVHVGTDASILFQLCLSLYGITLGFTHTPAAFYIGEVVDNFADPAAKDTANGIWNSMWEFGGSIGFLAGGAFAHSYEGELTVAVLFACCCCVASAGLLWMQASWPDAKSGKSTPKLGGHGHYGAV